MGYYGDSDCCVKIERLTNGFTVCIQDPAIIKFNKNRDKLNAKPNTPYIERKDPWKEFVFKDEREVIAFLGKNLKKAVAAKDDDYETSFDLAVASSPAKE
jgi:hypothetical protein